MEIIKEVDFRKEIKSNLGKCYLFFGEEDYMKSFALKLAVETISPEPSFSFFNEIRLDALSYSPDALLDSMMPLPMMAERKIIVVSGLDLNAMRADEIDALCSVLEKLDDYDYNTVIVSVASDRLDPGILPKKPSSTLKKFGECATLVNFEKNSPVKLSAWVGKHFEHNEVYAAPDVCAFVIERCGRDMFTLANEVDKLSFYALSKGRDAVSLEDVEEVSSISEEFDSFAFGNAVAEGDTEQALRILALIKARKLEPVIALGEITKTFSDMLAVKLLTAAGIAPADIAPMTKLHEYKVKLYQKNVADIPESRLRQAVEMCESADLALKQSPTGYVEIEKLICCTVEK